MIQQSCSELHTHNTHTHTQTPHTHMHIYLLSQLRGPRSNGRPMATTTPSTQILVSNNLNKRNQDSLGKCLFVGLMQETHKMFLKHLIMPERRQVLKQRKRNTERTKNNIGSVSKECRSWLKELLMPTPGTILPTE